MQGTRLIVAMLLAWLAGAVAASAAERVIFVPQRGGTEVACRTATSEEIAAAVAASNAVRRAHGLAPLRGSAALSRAAARQSCDMARDGRLRHAGATTRGPLERVKLLGYRPALAAENIAAGPWDLPQVFAAWNGSASHRANILLPQVREVGIGSAVRGGMIFWTAVYSAKATR